MPTIDDDIQATVAGVLALELAPGTTPACDALQQVDAGQLASLIGRDLAALDVDVSALDLVTAAAHFDPAEVLRPGWPLHRRLQELRIRAPGQADAHASAQLGQPRQARIIAIGAAADGRVPAPLRPQDELRGGQLRVLPFVLAGDPALTRQVAERMEAVLLDRGMAQADTALCAQEAFGARIEHARYLTVHDLTAMTALQYGNQGLEQLWPLIETALLRPDAECVLDAPPEPLLRYADGQVRIALFPPAIWRKLYASAVDGDADRIERIHRMFEARMRQYAAVLQAHDIQVVFAHCEDPAAL